MANYKIEDISGIGETYGAKLREMGVVDTDSLLKKACTPAGRKEMCEKTGLSGSHVLKWANMADLYRISGVGSQYAELLEEAGVDTVVELGTRKPENLHAKMKEVNDAKNLTNKLPTGDQVASWVNEAKSLDRVITH